jgi:hypothetical protein
MELTREREERREKRADSKVTLLSVLSMILKHCPEFSFSDAGWIISFVLTVIGCVTSIGFSSTSEGCHSSSASGIPSHNRPSKQCSPGDFETEEKWRIVD